MVTYKKLFSVLGLLVLILMATFISGLALGSVRVPVIGILKGRSDWTSWAILWNLRLPRVFMAGIVGWSLSIGGVVFQALMRNPLAEPFLLGLSSGAALGAVTGIILGVAFWGGIPAMAFLGAVTTIALVLLIAQRAGTVDPNTLVLTGVIINAFFAALIMFALATASGEKLHALLYWLYGDLSRSRFADLRVIIPVVLLSSVVIHGMSRSYNLIASGDEVASQLGVDVERARWTSLILVSFMCGITVAFSGIIGFVGLIVPHLVRMAFGPDHRLLLPASGFFGASFLIGADLLARTVIAPSELPVGVVTAFLGAPFFLYLLYLRKRPWTL